ncbi:uncharacterized protein VTP21DRAFT_8081 [Calcarisporiella thermophila]|uniref:uncharacterized protein n=1 Tax=Calcarisporiella thermophila TaxID=911321 RepID=UPI0037445C66
MTPEVFSIELTVDKAYLADVLRAILHSILFLRVFANVQPKDLEVLNISFPGIDDPDVTAQVEDKVAAFVRSMESAPTNGFTFKGQIAVMFYEKRTKKAWFSKSEEEVCWEQWTITLTVQAPPTERERLKLRKAMSSQLSHTLATMLRTVNEKRDHIPPITSNDNPFPYQIALPTSSDSWGSMLKRMLDTTPPVLS